MRWEIERYVRVYRRNTAEWALIPWQARGLFDEMLRVADRDGSIPYGRLTPARALAALLGGPPEEIDPWLKLLLEDGCVVDVTDVTAKRHAHCLVIPNYREAQDEPMTPAERTARWRKTQQNRDNQSDESDDDRHGRHPRDVGDESDAPSDPSDPSDPSIQQHAAAASPKPGQPRLPSALPSPAEADEQRWPLTAELARHLARLRGLTECPLFWPVREKRDRLESALARATVARASEWVFADWQQATAAGKQIKSLGAFIDGVERLAITARKEPLSDCAEWSEILEQYRKQGMHRDEIAQLAKTPGRVEGGELVLEAADAPTELMIDELHWKALVALASERGLGLRVTRRGRM